MYRNNRRGRAHLYGYTSMCEPDRHLMPFTDLDNFINDSTDNDLDLTMIKIDIDTKNINLYCFNKNGIKQKLYKKIPKQNVSVEKTQTVNIEDI